MRYTGPVCRLCRTEQSKLFLKGDRCKSDGVHQFRGAKKSTPFAAQTVAETAVQKALTVGLREVHVYVKGPGVGRESAIRQLGALGLKVRSINDVTPIPHNGCRPRKARRI